MENKKDKRSKNLDLREVRVGDWVQVWKGCYYSPPLRIISIHVDGTIYLAGSDEECLTPWEENIKDIDALPISSNILRGFGFNLKDKVVVAGGFIKQILYDNLPNPFVGYLYSLDGDIHCGIRGLGCKYMHEVYDRLLESYPDLKLEWKGVKES